MFESVEERCLRGEVEPVRFGGLQGRENAGMSNAKYVRNILTVSPRIPGEGSSAQGKAGPKARPRGVADGQQVANPVPREVRLYEGVTQKAR